MQETEDGISQACESLGGAVGADATGVFGKGGVAAPVEFVFDGPMGPVDIEEAIGGGALAGQAGDGVDGFVADLSGDFPGSADSADLGGARPLDVAGEFAGHGQFALLDAAVSLFDGAGDLEIGRRTIPEGFVRRPLTAQGSDQLRGERRRRRRRRCPPSGVVGWL
jgi:hypothetical protein